MVDIMVIGQHQTIGCLKDLLFREHDAVVCCHWRIIDAGHRYRGLAPVRGAELVGNGVIKGFVAGFTPG